METRFLAIAALAALLLVPASAAQVAGAADSALPCGSGTVGERVDCVLGCSYGGTVGERVDCAGAFAIGILLEVLEDACDLFGGCAVVDAAA